MRARPLRRAPRRPACPRRARPPPRRCGCARRRAAAGAERPALPPERHRDAVARTPRSSNHVSARSPRASPGERRARRSARRARRSARARTRRRSSRTRSAAWSAVVVVDPAGRSTASVVSSAWRTAARRRARRAAAACGLKTETRPRSIAAWLAPSRAPSVSPGGWRRGVAVRLMMGSVTNARGDETTSVPVRLWLGDRERGVARSGRASRASRASSRRAGAVTTPAPGQELLTRDGRAAAEGPPQGLAATRRVGGPRPGRRRAAPPVPAAGAPLPSDSGGRSRRTCVTAVPPARADRWRAPRGSLSGCSHSSVSSANRVGRFWLSCRAYLCRRCDERARGEQRDEDARVDAHGRRGPLDPGLCRTTARRAARAPSRPRARRSAVAAGTGGSAARSWRRKNEGEHRDGDPGGSPPRAMWKTWKRRARSASPSAVTWNQGSTIEKISAAAAPPVMLDWGGSEREARRRRSPPGADRGA